MRGGEPQGNQVIRHVMCPQSISPKGHFKAGTRVIQIKKKNTNSRNKNSQYNTKRVHLSTRPATGWAGHTFSYRKGARDTQKRRQGSTSTSSSPGASQEEVRANQSLNPQPRMDPTRACHHIRVECRGDKKMRTPNWSSKWWTQAPRKPISSGGKRQEVETLRISWALTEPTSGLDAPAA